MKILIDLTSLADNFSGIERYAACLSIELLKEESILYILLFKNKVHPLFSQFQTDKRVEMVVILGRNKLIFSQIQLPLKIYKYKADIYLFLAFPVPILLFKKNMVSTIHDICCWDCPETMKGLSAWYFRISFWVAAKKCKAIITVSKFSEERIVNRLKYTQGKIWLIYVGIDEKFLNYVPNEEEQKRIREQYHLPEHYILSLSTLEPRKNLGLLIRAYQQLYKDKKVHIPLVLAGRKGWNVGDLLKGIDDTVLENINFTGFINDQDLPTVYHNADLFVFPSKYEGFGIPVIEAMSQGVPVVCSDIASLIEITEGKVLLFENDNHENLMSRLKEFFAMTDLQKQEMIRQGYAISGRFRWQAEAEKLFAALDATYRNEAVRKQ